MSQKLNSLKQISSKYSNYFFDLDGVIWSGSKKIKGGVDALNYLRQNNKNIFFITNSSIRNRTMLKQRFTDFGFQAHFDEIYPSDYITSLYIKTTYPQVKKAMVVGAQTLVQQIRNAGIQAIHMDQVQFDEGEVISSIISKIDPSIDSIIMGYDFHLNYKKICLITFYVQKGAKFIATNPDKYTMIEGLKVPGCGSMVKVIEVATTKTAEIAGKPNPFIIEHLIKTHNLNKSECLMIGDNIDTDITFGKNAGIDTWCVLTGVSNEEMVQQSALPTYYSQFLL